MSRTTGNSPVSVNSSVSIVCVYSDPAVRRECLDRSVLPYSRDAADVEYLPVDNVDGRYRSAGAALNHGASLARNDVVVFVHQDVFLHSVTAVIRAAGQMQLGGFGVLGAVGVSRDGRIAGLIRDRAVLLGAPVQQPADVDSVDELLFMVPRSLVLRHPLTESPDMAWHAYAVEYGLRVRRLGLRVGVTDIPLTHNSLTTNLARLDVAHAAVAALYPEMLPVRTTCGVVGRQAAKRSAAGLLGSQRWRYSWLRESLTVRRARRMTAAPIVLADIRRDVDNVIEHAPDRRLRIVNCPGQARFMDADGGPLELTRRNGRVVVDTREISHVPEILAAGPSGSWFLLTNIPQEDLGDIGARWRSNRQVVGFHTGIGFWILLGAAAADLPPHWRSKRSVPLGMRRPMPEPASGLNTAKRMHMLDNGTKELSG
jgi:glycosyl transferase family 2